MERVNQTGRGEKENIKGAGRRNGDRIDENGISYRSRSTVEKGQKQEQENVTVEMLQNVRENRFKMLTSLNNIIKYWRRGQGTKRMGSYLKNSSNCSNYKGITSLSTVLKVYDRTLEKIVREILDT